MRAENLHSQVFWCTIDPVNSRRKNSRKEIPAKPEPIYLTADGRRRLQNKLERLKRELPGYIEETARTAAYGDRSDNAEYKESKSILRRTQRQIWTIEAQLKNITIIEPGRNAAGTVRLGSVVMLQPEDGTRKTFEIVGPFETDPSKGRISHLSPLGAALIGRCANDAVTISTAAGKRKYRILEVR